MTSPSPSSVPSGIFMVWATMSISMDSVPHTAVLPMPRATTAAWEVLPPRVVRMPAAATMPGGSSGLVSPAHEDHIAALSSGDHRVLGLKTTSPTAAPGSSGALGGRLLAVAAVELREHQLGQLRSRTRGAASSMSMRSSSTSWVAMRKAAQRCVCRRGSAASTASRVRW